MPMKYSLRIHACLITMVSIVIATASSRVLCEPKHRTIKLNVANIPWAQKVAEKVKDQQVSLCGPPSLILTKKSLAKDFFFKNETRSYFFTGLVNHNDFYDFMSKNSRKELDPKIKELFGNAKLYSIDKKTFAIEEIGAPASVDIKDITATILDCKNGSKTSIGNDCPAREKSELEYCCREKFIGPTVYFGPDRSFNLGYTPDPSIRLKVKGQKIAYFCHIFENLYLKSE